jgi:hypothetical protein
MARFEQAAQDSREAIRLGGRGFAPDKREAERNVAREATQRNRDDTQQRGDVDPEHTLAAQTLHDLELGRDTDFDGGITRIKGGVRSASSAGRVALALHADVLGDNQWLQESASHPTFAIYCRKVLKVSNAMPANKPPTQSKIDFTTKTLNTHTNAQC